MNATPRRLIVTWKNESSPRIIPVAEFLVIGNGTRYEFGYLEGVHEAAQYGFQPFLAFPRLDARYHSEHLFPFFANRVLPTTRPDYLDSLRVVGLDPAEASVAELLGRTNGRRATDRIETILVPVPDSRGWYVTRFLVRGVRHVAGADSAISNLQRGDRLTVAVDEGNQYNSRARKLLSATGAPVGYVPDYLIGDLDKLERAGASPAVFVERINPPPTPMHYRVLCRVESGWPHGFVPFDDARLTSYVARHAA